MKKNIWDVCKNCIIEIPRELYHENNLLVWMIDSIDFPTKEKHVFMKKNFPWISAVCIKKDSNSIIGQEYYFIPKVKAFDDVAKLLWYEYFSQIHDYNYVEYSFDFHDDQWEANLFDQTTAAYVIEANQVYMKNLYFWFQQHQKQEAFENMKKNMYPYTDEELLQLLSWNDFQREDGHMIIGKKTNAQSIYFSRINFLGFLKFIKLYRWDEYIWKFITEHSEYLKYYLFDINLQYTYEDWKMKVGKTSIYWLI